MKRNILKLSERSHAVTLPTEFMRKHSLKKGDQVQVSQNSKSITFNLNQPKEINLNIENQNVQVIIKSIVNIYQFGYDKVKLTFSKETKNLKTNEEQSTIELIKETCNHLIGFEVVNQGDDYCVIKDVTEFNGEEFKTILRRSFLLLNDFARESFHNIKDNKKENLQGKHVCIRKFVNYCKRYLNKYGKAEKTSAYVGLIENIIMISNALRVISRENNKYSSKVLRMYNDTILLLEEVYSNFYTFDLDKSSSILAKRKSIFDSFEFETKNDAVLSQRLAVVLNGVYGLTDSTMSIRFGGEE